MIYTAQCFTYRVGYMCGIDGAASKTDYMQAVHSFVTKTTHAHTAVSFLHMCMYCVLKSVFYSIQLKN